MTDLEKKLRVHPMVEPRLAHKRDMHAAEAAVQECIHGTAIPVDSWKRSSTVQQVRIAFNQLTGQK
jgi:hypothetical protein